MLGAARNNEEHGELQPKKTATNWKAVRHDLYWDLSGFASHCRKPCRRAWSMVSDNHVLQVLIIFTGSDRPWITKACDGPGCSLTLDRQFNLSEVSIGLEISDTNGGDGEKSADGALETMPVGCTGSCRDTHSDCEPKETAFKNAITRHVSEHCHP